MLRLPALLLILAVGALQTARTLSKRPRVGGRHPSREGRCELPDYPLELTSPGS